MFCARIRPRNLARNSPDPQTAVCIDWQADVSEQSNRFDALKVYEQGKHRRYSLLFAVSGGAFALTRYERVLGKLGLPELSVGMAIFATVMVLDIEAFGVRMRKEDETLFSGIGRGVLLTIGFLIVTGWMLTGFGSESAAWGSMIYVVIVGALTAYRYIYEPDRNGGGKSSR